MSLKVSDQLYIVCGFFPLRLRNLQVKTRNGKFTYTVYLFFPRVIVWEHFHARLLSSISLLIHNVPFLSSTIEFRPHHMQVMQHVKSFYDYFSLEWTLLACCIAQESHHRCRIARCYCKNPDASRKICSVTKLNKGFTQRKSNFNNYEIPRLIFSLWVNNCHINTL